MPGLMKTTGVRLWIAQALLAGLFLFAGALKVVMPLDALQGPVPVPSSVLRFIGVAEILGAAGLMLPGPLQVARVLTPIAALGLVLIMAGATTITLERGAVAPALVPLALGALAATVVYGGRPWLGIGRVGCAPVSFGLGGGVARILQDGGAS